MKITIESNERIYSADIPDDIHEAIDAFFNMLLSAGYNRVTAEDAFLDKAELIKQEQKNEI